MECVIFWRFVGVDQHVLAKLGGLPTPSATPVATPLLAEASVEKDGEIKTVKGARKTLKSQLKTWSVRKGVKAKRPLLM